MKRIQRLFLILTLLVCGAISARATGITVSSFTTSGVYQQADTVVQLRLYYSKTFVDSLGNVIVGGAPGSTNFFKTVTCSLNTTTKILTVPSFVMPSTTDSSKTHVTVTGVLFGGRTASSVAQRSVLFSNWKVPTSLGTTITYSSLNTYNAARPLPNNPPYLNRDEVASLISTAIGSQNNASSTTKGIAKLSVDPVSAVNPIAQADNVSRVGVLASTWASLSAAVTAIGSTSTILDITTAFPSGATVTVPSTLTLRFTKGGSIVLGAGHTVTVNSASSGWPDEPIFSGSGSLAIASPIVRPSWFSGDLAQKIVSALAVCSSAVGSGCTVDARMFKGAQTGSVSVTISKKNTNVLLGPLQIAMGSNQWIVSAGADGVSIQGSTPWGGLPIDGSVLTGTVIHYTGAGVAVAIGTNVEHTENFVMSDAAVVTDAAAANGIQLRSTMMALLDRVRVVSRALGTATGAGIYLLGSGTDQTYSAYNRIQQPVIDNYRVGIVFASTIPSVNNNVNQVIGGRINGKGAGVESYGIDIQAGLSNSIRDIDIENCNIGLSINSPLNYGSNVNFEGVGTSASAPLAGNGLVFTAHAIGNHVDFAFVNPGNGNTFVSDSGSLNTYNWRSFNPNLQSGDVPVRMTTAQRDSLPAPRAGTTIWNLTTSKRQVWTGAAWVDLH